MENNKLQIEAINKSNQRLINQWIERQIKYTETVNVISKKQDLEQSTATLERKEEHIYSSILDIESELPKRELTKAKKEYCRFFGYEA
jgi:hypothetical protein